MASVTEILSIPTPTVPPGPESVTLPRTSVPVRLPKKNHPVQRLVIRQADWRLYEGLLELIDGRDIRINYDRGVLELMAPLRIHEFMKGFLCDLITIMTTELKIRRSNCGSMTIRSQDLDRGFEPDACFYFANQPQVGRKRELDFTKDPPPDLSIEIDVTSSCIDRLGLYAAIGVPEIWKYDGDELQFLHLQADKSYKPAAHSLSFPRLAVEDVVRFAESDFPDDSALETAFRAWVRTNLVPAAAGESPPPP